MKTLTIRARTTERVPQPIRTTDSASTRDTLLSAVDPGRCTDLGVVWDGVSKAIRRAADEIKALVTPLQSGKTLSPEQLEQCVRLGRVWNGLTAFEQIVNESRASGNEPSGNTGASDAAAMAEQISEISRQHAKFWAERNETEYRDHAPKVESTPAAMQAAQDAFWGRK